MPRFHFHVECDGERILDEEGSEMSDLSPSSALPCGLLPTSLPMTSNGASKGSNNSSLSRTSAGRRYSASELSPLSTFRRHSACKPG
jgi:hypothetical protein